MSVQSHLRAAIAFMTVISIGAGKLAAQSAGTDSVSATTQVTVSVSSLLRMTALEVVDVRRSKTVTEVSSAVTVHGNVSYRVAVRAARTGSAGVQVKDVAGAWTALPESASLDVAAGEPGVTSVRVQCRVLGLSASTPADGCALEYELLEGASTTAPRAHAILALTEVNTAPTNVRLAHATGTL